MQVSNISDPTVQATMFVSINGDFVAAQRVAGKLRTAILHNETKVLQAVFQCLVARSAQSGAGYLSLAARRLVDQQLVTGPHKDVKKDVRTAWMRYTRYTAGSVATHHHPVQCLPTKDGQPLHTLKHKPMVARALGTGT